MSQGDSFLHFLPSFRLLYFVFSTCNTSFLRFYSIVSFLDDCNISRFAAFRMIDEQKSNIVEPNSQVTLRINESIERLMDWVKSAFLFSDVVPISATSDKVKICFVSVCRPSKHAPAQAVSSSGNHRNRHTDPQFIPQPLHIVANKVTVDDGKPNLRVRIRCDDMDLAADLIQDLAR